MVTHTGLIHSAITRRQAYVLASVIAETKPTRLDTNITDVVTSSGPVVVHW